MEKHFLKDLNWNLLVFLFIFGFVLGVSLKNIATEKITIGYNDYRLKSLKSDYSFQKEDRVNVENKDKGE